MTFIIAEAGINHNGDYKTAEKLCHAAKEAHADAVKFQMFDSQKLWGDDRIKHLELCEAEFINLHWLCKEIGIEFMATPFDPWACEFLQMLGVKRMKIASGCLNRWDIIDRVDRKIPIILSTGMSTVEEVGGAVRRIQNDLTLLQCTSAYPCPPDKVDLGVMRQYRIEFPRCKVGFSDHTETGVAAIAAAALGASVIEKHLTLDRGQKGPDHKASIEPMTFALMVQSIRAVEKMGGDTKRVWEDEAPLRKAWRRD